MVLSTIRMAIPAEKHIDALKILKSIAQKSRDSSGSISSHIYRDIENSDILMIQECWEVVEKFELHARSDEYRNLLLVMEMSLKQPEVRFDTISESMGIETIEIIRSDFRDE